jgi:hypothetical protein
MFSSSAFEKKTSQGIMKYIFIVFLRVPYLLYPLASIDECFVPWSNLVGQAALFWIVTALPWELCALRVWHDGEVTSVLASQCSHVVCRTIRVGWILRVVVFGNHVVFTLCQWQVELAFSVGHPATYLLA